MLTCAPCFWIRATQFNQPGFEARLEIIASIVRPCERRASERHYREYRVSKCGTVGITFSSQSLAGRRDASGLWRLTNVREL
jgi:hypothetical protein